MKRSGPARQDGGSAFSRTPFRLSRRAIAAVIVVTAIVAALNVWSVKSHIEALLASATLPVGLLLLLDARLRWTISRRLARASCTPIRNTNDGPAAVRGRIVASDAGLFISPPSGRSVVWARLEVFQTDVEGTSLSKSLTAARDFLIDDGSGEPARVVAKGAWVAVEGSPPHRIDDIDPATRALFEARGAGDGRYLEETLLAPGDEVVVVGPARRAPIAAESSTAPTLVFEGRVRRVDELLVSRWPPAASGPPTFVVPLSVAMVVTGCGPVLFALWSRWHA